MGPPEVENPTTSTEYVLAAPGRLDTRKRQFDRVPVGWVRVRFLYCGLCGSDISYFEGRPGTTYPMTIGHEFVGEVVDIGDGVDDFRPGDVVTSDLNFRCGTCDQCRAGRSHLCRIGQQGLFTNRGFSDLADLDSSYLIRLESPPGRHLTLIEPLSCVLHALAWASPFDEDRVLVIGAGSIGLCMALALCNREPPVSFEITDSMAARLDRIAAVIGPRGLSAPKPTGEYDAIFDLSGTEAGLRRACELVRPGGKICSMSHPTGDPVSPFLVGAIMRRDITFTVSYLNGERSTLVEAARLLERHWDLDWDEMIEPIPVNRLQEAYEQRRSSPWCKTVIEIANP
jgi:threonine dehydrogenase-like Zn-dependent dehydrogenase